jgi:S-adenosylmethionine hydrolase
VDEYVGVVHAVLHATARARSGDGPPLSIIDLAHDVPAFDVRAGADLLERSVRYLPPDSVVLAVVDPGVGSARRRIALAAGRVRLVGPDNGLLAGPAERLGGVDQVVALTDPAWWLHSRSTTFDGRDVFAPVAAALAVGAELDDVGEAVDPGSLARLEAPRWSIGPSHIEAEVVRVDGFGTLVLAAPAEVLERAGDRLELSWRRAGAPVGVGLSAAPAALAVRVVGSFHELALGEIGVMADSCARASVVAGRASAADILGMLPGDVVRLGHRFAGGGPGAI